MKKKALAKDTLREIKKSFGRFISIFAIVGIGVAFYTGVKASAPIMKGSADTYFKDYNLMDFKLQSTLGLVKDDVVALSNIKGVSGVYASHSLDAISSKDATQSVVKVLSMPLQAKEEDSDYINQYHVIEGRLPKNEKECVIEADTISPSGYALGDSIVLSSGSEEDIKDSLKNNTYTVVGKVMTPYYLSYEKGSSSIGNGKVSRYIAVADTNFKSDIYTEIYLTLEGAKDYNSYSDAYFDYIKPIEKKIKKLSTAQASLRLQDIKASAQEELDKGILEYEENKKSFDRKIAEAKAQISDGEAQLASGKSELQTSIQTTQATFAQKQQELDDSKVLLADMERQYNSGMSEFTKNQQDYESAKPELQAQLQELKNNLSQLEQGISGLDQALKNPALSEEERQALQAQREELLQNQRDAMAGIQTIEQTMSATQTQLDMAASQLAQLKAGIDTMKPQLTQGEEQLQQGRITAQSAFTDARVEIAKSEQELETSKQTLENEEKDGLEKLAEAKETIDKSEQDINDLTAGKWYILDRHSHYSYMDYGGAADRMDGIAKVFPVFFYLVAALVCLTTMTRMVDEQRQEIGTLKALGYTKFYIAMKYIAYAGVASIFGGIFGAIVGMIIFPTVIYNAWAIMYLMPPVVLHAEVSMAALSIAIAAFVTIAASIFACYKELMETPALLMRPKAPKNGKKIILERIPFVWKHFNFIHKVTARNIFRYKKRFLMTVIGISGCTALLVAGYGVRDSISEIVEKQYGEIYKFDMSITYKKENTRSIREQLSKELSEDARISKHMEVSIVPATFQEKGADQSIDIYVVKDTKAFSQFIDLRTRHGQNEVPISEEGAVISEHIAKRKGISIGEYIEIDNGSGVKKVKITGICENYVGHALYMSPTYYTSIYKEQAKASGQLLKIKNLSKQNTISNTYMKEEGVEAVTYYKALASSFDDMISSLSFIVIVLIISAGLLAFVVLYNLTNVNISERLREIATIKVLGFYDKEVSAYVYRENIVLTVIGGASGLVLGIGLHSLIMDLAELDNVMFGRNINMISFVYSFLITMLFAIIVNLVMYNKLKKIPMVESLKSVE